MQVGHKALVHGTELPKQQEHQIMTVNSSTLNCAILSYDTM